METPPNNAEAEMAVLGAVLIDPSCLDTINTIITPAAFYAEKNGWIFEAMLNLKARGEPIDLLSVSDALEAQGKLKPVGGEGYISNLVTSVPTSLHAEHYATLIRKTYNKRRLIDASRFIAKAAFDDKIDDEDAYLAALNYLNKAEPTGLPTQVVGGPDMMDNMFAVLLQAQREKNARKTDPEMIWPWDCMRKYLKRWRIGQPAILIAEGGAGKTAFCMEVAGFNAQNGGNIIYVHTEDEVLTLLGRRLSTISGIPYSTIEQASYADDGLIDVDMQGIKVWVPPNIVKSVSSIRSWRGNLWFLPASGKTVPEILYTLNRVVQQTGHPDAVIFDWFLDHKMRDGVDSKVEKLISDIQELSQYCRKERTRLLVATQTGKEGSTKSRLSAYDAFYTSAMAHYGKIVMTIKRERELVNGEAVGAFKPEMQVFIAKANLDATGIVKLKVQPEIFRIYEDKEPTSAPPTVKKLPRDIWEEEL